MPKQITITVPTNRELKKIVLRHFNNAVYGGSNAS